MAGRHITPEYLQLLQGLGLTVKTEQNPFLVLRMQGDGSRAPDSFNFKVYRNAAGQLSLVTTDENQLEKLLSGAQPVSKEGKRVISIDDSGWGFPYGGVLCGIYDSDSQSFRYAEVPVTYFQSPHFEAKEYLTGTRDAAISLLDSFARKPSIDNTVMSVCGGYINSAIVTELRNRGFPVIVEFIEDPLQTMIEAQQRRYIQELLGEDLYYDPKQFQAQDGSVDKAAIARQFNEVVEHVEAQKPNHLELAKSGWNYFKRRYPNTIPQAVPISQSPNYQRPSLRRNDPNQGTFNF